jgi:EpsI family protein
MPPLDPRVLAVLGADDHLMRLYQDPGGRPLSLYVGFHAAQQRGDSIHSPMNCLPGAGWQPITAERLEIADHRNGPASADRTVTVNGVTIEKGDTRQLVLYWYLSQGRVIASEYRAKGYLFLDALRTGRSDAALIRIVTPLDRSPGDIDQARATATAFAGDLLPLLAPFIPE